jgi:hypothetical protein
VVRKKVYLENFISSSNPRLSGRQHHRGVSSKP